MTRAGARLIRRAAVAAAAAGIIVVSAVPASASGSALRIRQADVSSNGSVRLVVSLGGDAAGKPLSASDLKITEGSKPVDGVQVAPLKASDQQTYVALAIDVSGSTAGKPIADAKSAAKAFVGTLDPSVHIAVVSFGDKAWLVSSMSTDRASTLSAIDALGSGGATALNDAVALSAAQVKGSPGLHRVIVFTDGRDTVKGTSLDAAIAAANSAGAPVDAVALTTADSDSTALSRLSRDTHGSVVEVAGTAGLAGAFKAVANEISSQFIVTYTAHSTASQLDIAVAAFGAADSIVVANSRKAPPPALAPAPGPAAPPVNALAGKLGLFIGLAAAFGFLAILGGTLVWRRARSEGGVALDRGLKALKKGKPARKAGGDTTSVIAGIGHAADKALAKLSSSRAMQAKLQKRLEGAGWPMRASEFLMLQGGATIAGLTVGWLVSGMWFGGVAAAVGCAFIPRVILSQRIAKREAAFLRQLPDTLQLLAGSLQAGYGFMQALDTLVKESPEPTASEFGRVLAEARLGVPADDALAEMAERVGNDDFRWVVLAISIQRQVGGNLAELLRTVAGTLREREAVRRQIKTLSAEGRLSGVILTVMPFAIATYIFIVNPGYLQQLFSSSLGRMLAIGAVVLMGLGMAWMRKIIRIKV